MYFGVEEGKVCCKVVMSRLECKKVNKIIEIYVFVCVRLLSLDCIKVVSWYRCKYRFF